MTMEQVIKNRSLSYQYTFLGVVSEDSDFRKLMKLLACPLIAARLRSHRYVFMHKT